MALRTKKRDWNTPEEYVDAAIRLAAAQGFFRLTTTRIARSLGKEGGQAVDHHFSKRAGEHEYLPAIRRAILKRCWETVQGLLVDALSELPEDAPPLLRFRRIIRRFAAIARMEANDDRKRHLLVLSMHYRDPAADFRDKRLLVFINPLAKMLRESQQAGLVVPDIRPPAIREAIVGAFLELVFFKHVMNLGRLAKAEHYDVDDINACMESVVLGFLTEEGTRVWRGENAPT